MNHMFLQPNSKSTTADIKPFRTISFTALDMYESISWIYWCQHTVYAHSPIYSTQRWTPRWDTCDSRSSRALESWVSKNVAMYHDWVVTWDRCGSGGTSTLWTTLIDDARQVVCQMEEIKASRRNLRYYLSLFDEQMNSK